MSIRPFRQPGPGEVPVLRADRDEKLFRPGPAHAALRDSRSFTNQFGGGFTEVRTIEVTVRKLRWRGYCPGVVRVDAASRRLLRARDKMDRSYAKPLDVPALARVALTSEAHFIRTFKQTFGETPHRYLQRRRLERAMALLRETERPVTEICLDVGFASLGTFSRTFTRVVGMSPTAYRQAWRTGAGTAGYVPTCVVMSWTRPRTAAQDSNFGEADREGAP